MIPMSLITWNVQSWEQSTAIFQWTNILLFFGKIFFTDSVTKRGNKTNSVASICPNKIYIYFRSSLTNDSYCFYPNSMFLIVFVKLWSEIFLVSSAWTSTLFSIYGFLLSSVSSITALSCFLNVLCTLQTFSWWR